MRRAYVESHVPLREAVQTARQWAGANATIRVPDTSSVEENEWMAGLEIPISSSSSRSRFRGLPRGTVIGFCLDVSEVLEVERSRGVEGIVVVQAHGPVRYAEGVPSHAPWITAFDVETAGWQGGRAGPRGVSAAKGRRGRAFRPRGEQPRAGR